MRNFYTFINTATLDNEKLNSVQTHDKTFDESKFSTGPFTAKPIEINIR